MDIYERDKLRNRIIIELYLFTDASTRRPVEISELGQELKLPSDEVRKAFYYFVDEGLIKPHGMGYHAEITHDGIKFVESMLRHIDFSQNIEFNSTELYQLKVMLDEIKEELSKLSLGQEVVFNAIDEVFEKSKETSKKDWAKYFEEKILEWSTEKVIDKSASLIIQSLIYGLKISS